MSTEGLTAAGLPDDTIIAPPAFIVGGAITLGPETDHTVMQFLVMLVDADEDDTPYLLQLITDTDFAKSIGIIPSPAFPEETPV